MYIVDRPHIETIDIWIKTWHVEEWIQWGRIYYGGKAIEIGVEIFKRK